jgi:hypothetical protein
MKYVAIVTNKNGKTVYTSLAHISRDAAAREALNARPRAKTCSTCIAMHPLLQCGWSSVEPEPATPSHRDIRWHNRSDFFHRNNA